MADHYQPPGRFTTQVLNRIIAGLTRAGLGVYGSRVGSGRGVESR